MKCKICKKEIKPSKYGEMVLSTQVFPHWENHKCNQENKTIEENGIINPDMGGQR